jgi:hypothetical protein
MFILLGSTCQAAEKNSEISLQTPYWGCVKVELKGLPGGFPAAHF